MYRQGSYQDRKLKSNKVSSQINKSNIKVKIEEEEIKDSLSISSEEKFFENRNLILNSYLDGNWFICLIDEINKTVNPKINIKENAEKESLNQHWEIFERNLIFKLLIFI